jgi:hypothetical protein
MSAPDLKRNSVNQQRVQLLIGLLFYAVAGFTVLVPLVWPAALNLVLDGLFWSSFMLLLLCGWIIGYLYSSKGGSGRNARFCLGICLIFAAISLTLAIGQIERTVDMWQPHFPGSYWGFFYWLGTGIESAEHIISFGIAALGANVAASAITERDPNS